jgi:hypothetical protein
MPCLIVPPCQGCSPGRALWPLNRVMPCHWAWRPALPVPAWAQRARPHPAAVGARSSHHCRRAPHAGSTQPGAAIAHPTAPGLAVPKLPLAVALLLLQILSLCAKTSSPHRVRRVHAASTRRREGARDSELAGDGIREATRDSEYEQRATGIGIERKGGQVQRVRVSQGVFSIYRTLFGDPTAMVHPENILRSKIIEPHCAGVISRAVPGHSTTTGPCQARAR